jgi:hypothetical protein
LMRSAIAGLSSPAMPHSAGILACTYSAVASAEFDGEAVRVEIVLIDGSAGGKFRGAFRRLLPDGDRADAEDVLRRPSTRAASTAPRGRVSRGRFDGGNGIVGVRWFRLPRRSTTTVSPSDPAGNHRRRRRGEPAVAIAFREERAQAGPQFAVEERVVGGRVALRRHLPHWTPGTTPICSATAAQRSSRECVREGACRRRATRARRRCATLRSVPREPSADGDGRRTFVAAGKAHACPGRLRRLALGAPGCAHEGRP